MVDKFSDFLFFELYWYVFLKGRELMLMDGFFFDYRYMIMYFFLEFVLRLVNREPENPRIDVY